MEEKLRFITWTNVIVVAFFVILVFSQANKRFILDEVDFPVLANAISETGLPYHYRGEQDTSSLGLWHPPLYAYSLAVFVKVFGFNENTVRAFGMCCTLLSALLCILIYRELFQLKMIAINRITPIFLSLFLLHPYTIANTTVPDIDSTVLPVTILIFIYGLIRMFGPGKAVMLHQWPLKRIILLSVLFAVNLWAKLTTPLMLIPTAFLIFCIKGWSLQRSVVIAITFAALGGIIFLITYWLYCYLLNLPFDFTFQFLIFSFTKNSSSGGGVSALVAGIISHLSYAKYFVNWLGLPFLFALTLSFFALIIQKTKSESENILLVLAGFGLFVTVFYLGLTGAYGGFFKYPYPIFAILVLMVTHYIHGHLFLKEVEDNTIRCNYQDVTLEFRYNQLWLLFFASILSLASYYQLVVAKDVAIFENRPVAVGFIFLVIGIAAAISVLTAKKPDNLVLTLGLSILLAVMVGTQFGISRSQAVAIYPTKYNYGQTGFEETVSYLKGRLAPNEPIWTMKDIGHYTNGKFIEDANSVGDTAVEITNKFRIVINNNGVRYFVVTKGIGQIRVDAYAELKSALDTCCVMDQEFGNFVIYKVR